MATTTVPALPPDPARTPDPPPATPFKPARNSGCISVPGTTSPWERRPGCPHRPPTGATSTEVPPHASAPDPARRAVHGGAPRRPRRSRIAAAKATLGDRLFILGHHYQRDEVIRWADARGDSYRLSVLAQQRPEADYIVFCGVHFMAESADILTADHQTVILPDLNAGCSMADMADIDEVEEAWEALPSVIDIDRVVPITYMNSSAALKAFVGRHGGAVCTSTNARAVLEWALGAGPGRGAAATRCCSSPTSTSAATPASPWATARRHAVWDPRHDLGGLTEADCKEATFLLWRGHCSIHQRFRPSTSRPSGPSTPTASWSSTPSAPRDRGSWPTRSGRPTTSSGRWPRPRPDRRSPSAPRSTSVNRLAHEHPDKTVVSLDPLICPCSTMNRIDEPHLAWVLEELVEGRVVNRITVDADTAEWARWPSSGCSTSPDRHSAGILRPAAVGSGRGRSSAPGPWAGGAGGGRAAARWGGRPARRPSSKASPWWTVQGGPSVGGRWPRPSVETTRGPGSGPGSSAG